MQIKNNQSKNPEPEISFERSIYSVYRLLSCIPKFVSFQLICVLNSLGCNQINKILWLFIFIYSTYEFKSNLRISKLIIHQNYCVYVRTTYRALKSNFILLILTTSGRKKDDNFFLNFIMQGNEKRIRNL